MVREGRDSTEGKGSRHREPKWKCLGLQETCFVRSCKEARGSKRGEQRKSFVAEWSYPAPTCWLG